MINYLYNRLSILLGGENISGGDTGTVKIETAQSVSPHRYADEMQRQRRELAESSTKEKS